jgi:hypothetical protein
MNFKLIMALLIVGTLRAQAPRSTTPTLDNPYYFEPPVASVDLRIAKRARTTLNSSEKWNRADTRVCREPSCTSGCPEKATAFSLYCALEKATEELGAKFEHRSAVMQQARLVLNEIAPRKGHVLQGYNNDPTTTFADIQKVLKLLEDRISKRLSEESQVTR